MPNLLGITRLNTQHEACMNKQSLILALLEIILKSRVLSCGGVGVKFMVKLTLNIPRYRVRIAISNRRPVYRDRFLQALDELIKVRAGSRISRVFRFIANGRKFQKILGGSLAFLIVLTNMFPPADAASAANGETEIVALAPAEQPIQTNVVRRLPVDGKLSITQGYRAFHAGVDIDGLTGDPIYPYQNGKVEFAGRDFFLGKVVKVRHEEGYESVYAHLDSIGVSAGQEVNTKTKLGEMGNTGHSFGDHLHLEVYKDGRHVNPTSVLPVK